MNALHYGEQASVTTAYNQAKLDLEAHLEAVPHVPGCREYGLGFAVEAYILSGAFEHFLEKVDEILARMNTNFAKRKLGDFCCTCVCFRARIYVGIRCCFV